ncbi:hypothetical protein G6F63_015298 [Rhizopus arrhizus]|nr:hypothetical protein G6F63_015298 [Rhizopus arrhizus]
MANAIDLLVRLVALAGDQDDVAGTGTLHRQADRTRAAALHGHGIGILETGQDVGHDHVAVLATRVVVGDDDLVGQARGNGGHLRALAGIALATAAEHAEQRAVQVAVQAVQRLFQRQQCRLIPVQGHRSAGIGAHHVRRRPQCLRRGFPLRDR